jgi:hypothetical protein
LSASKHSFGISTLRVGLFLIFLAFPTVFLRDQFLGASGSAYLAIGTFFFVVSVIAAFLGVMLLNYVAAYIAFLAVLATELILNQSTVIFSVHIAIALIFAEGVSSLQPYQVVARSLRYGERENVSVELRMCMSRYRRAFLVVTSSLLVVSFGYSILPQILPIVSDLAALALYAAIGLVAIAITTLYLGQRAESGSGRSST